MSIKAGELNNKCTLQRPVNTRNAYGEAVVSYEDAGTAWAKIQPLWSRELQSLRSVYPMVSHRLTVRAIDTAEVKPSWRLLFGSRKFNIDAVTEEDEAGETRHLIATELL